MVGVSKTVIKFSSRHYWGHLYGEKSLDVVDDGDDDEE